MINCEKKTIGKNLVIGKNVKITCDELVIGNDVIIGDNTRIFAHGMFKIGNLSTLGSNTIIKGNNISFGSEFFGTGRLEVGGGGWSNPESNLVIKDRCVMHNNHININCPVTIGNHVGLSPNVELITHGYWQSFLKGFPFREGPITINDNAIIGRNSSILPNINIGESAVIGAGSVVSKDILPFHVVGGVPAKTIYVINPDNMDIKEKEQLAQKVIDEYRNSLSFRQIDGVDINLEFPKVYLDEAVFDLETETFKVKEHSELTDDFRDFMRRKGVWFYGRRFKSIMRMKK